MDTSKLAARVEARNRVNKEANQMRATTIAAFRFHIGKKIINTDLHLAAKYKDLAPIAGPGIDHVWHSTSQWQLCFTVRCIASVASHQHHNFYAEQTFAIGDLQNGVLVNVKDIGTIEPFKTDYTVAEIVRLREACTEAKRAATAAENALYPFGECDS